MEEKQFSYNNRAGVKILFEYTSPTTISVLSPISRRGGNQDDIQFIDFNDGPFLFKGMDFNDIIYNGKLKPFLDDPVKRIVTDIIQDLMGITIVFKKIDKK